MAESLYGNAYVLGDYSKDGAPDEAYTYGNLKIRYNKTTWSGKDIASANYSITGGTTYYLAGDLEFLWVVPQEVIPILELTQNIVHYLTTLGESITQVRNPHSCYPGNW